jgi:nucleotide-binding universal stress UspA family protein
MWRVPPADILVAVDFGGPSARALTVAGALAMRFGATLTVAYAEIFEPPAYFTTEQIGRYQAQNREARSAARTHLLGFAAEHTAAPVEAVILEMPPAEAVLAAATGKDLIVMGTHGRRGPGRWWLGSVAERVVRAAPVPVLVVREAPAGTPAAPLFLRPLVLARHDRPAAAADDYARLLAEAFGGHIDTADALACDADTIARSSAVVVDSGPDAGRAISDSALLTSCTQPILFVPARVAPPAVEQPA